MQAALRPCAQPGCLELVSAGRCPSHQRAKYAERGSAHSRGYGVTWRRFRAAYIRDIVALNPWCLDCRRQFTRPSDIQLHHTRKVTDHPEMQFDPANIKHLCEPCHAIRTGLGE